VFDAPGGEEWIFVVAATDGHLYCHRKENKQIPRFQHTSFLGGEAVRVAGKLVVENGKLVALNLHSGQYKPREDRDLVTFLRLLERHGCCLSSISVAVQRIIKSARDGGIYGAAKKHKKDCEILWRGSHTVWYLEHKRNASDFLADIRLLRSQIEHEASQEEGHSRRASGQTLGYHHEGTVGLPQWVLAEYKLKQHEAERALATAGARLRVAQAEHEAEVRTDQHSRPQTTRVIRRSRSGGTTVSAEAVAAIRAFKAKNPDLGVHHNL
jgi:hypothetical protein